MGDSWMTVLAIGVAVIIMGIFPLMSMADQTDKTTNLNVQSATTKLDNEIRATGVLTLDQYQNFVLTLAATGNSYDVSIEAQIADGNLDKKEGTSSEKIYFTKYHTQIMDELSANGKIIFNEGDVVSITVKNTNTTIAYQLKNFMYKITGNNTATITAEATGMVTTSGN